MSKPKRIALSMQTPVDLAVGLFDGGDNDLRVELDFSALYRLPRR